MPNTWSPEPQLLESLTRAVPGILSSQKPNGEFGTEPWICRDQNLLLPLAVAWGLEGSAYHHDATVLDAIISGGDALINDADEQGRWINRKKDNSTWGPHHMPWTYSRWVRAYGICREAFPEEARGRWDQALTLGYGEIARTRLSHVHNQPAHQAMGLYRAGQVLQRDDWKQQVSDFMDTVVKAQSPHGWWAEHEGPVVNYNFVYMEALGAYFSMSNDERVLPALDRAARYHANFTYPDGSPVETVDGRNPYHSGLKLGNPGFSHTPVGRGYLFQQHRAFLAQGKSFSSDYAANMLLHAGSGVTEDLQTDSDRRIYRMGEEAVVLRQRPWFLCASALTTEIPPNRWGQDRQNFISIFHDTRGLILGGGNTKLQPFWSTFTVGDTALLSHTPGDEDPDFSPREGLLHVPDRASYDADESRTTLTLGYGPETCTVECEPIDEGRLRLTLDATSLTGDPIEAHLTFIPDLSCPVRLASGEELGLSEEPLEVSGPDLGDHVEHAGWRLSLPRGATLLWPAREHNPYEKAGRSPLESARLVVALPFNRDTRRYQLELQVSEQ
jgi:hypothetical protein